eukprot:gnl/Dysnectes_brevis/3450_a4362_852.p1 GENE.gnl/Dysnectes_brevis/3450_a4362_852~~gnl/Dysnectes_brevis/3450_a4362_852.p1  ORF type:complete len:604 (-),score=73.98 gnl/Dysnectes_brevis/3450_a4362_852:34-1845(-)
MSSTSGKTIRAQLAERSDIVFGLVGAIGVEFNAIYSSISDNISHFGYTPHMIKVTDGVFTEGEELIESKGCSKTSPKQDNVFSKKIDLGNHIRDLTTSMPYDLTAQLIVSQIRHHRGRYLPKTERVTQGGSQADDDERVPHAFVINSIKHPDEVSLLQQVYRSNFFLISIHQSKKACLNRICLILDRENPGSQSKKKRIETAELLLERDRKEELKYGQRVSATFQLGDFFISFQNRNNHIVRILNLIFGHPQQSPTAEESAMFAAFSAAVKSSDLSRQVGAVIVNSYDEVIATGPNEVPRAGGGHYRAQRTPQGAVDHIGSDFTLPQGDPNKYEINLILKKIRKKLSSSVLKGIDERVLDQTMDVIGSSESGFGFISEFQRAVHAEMQAITACARRGVAIRGCSIYCTTYPCQNCAKHIVAAGITKVVFIEPYDKSQALHLHKDAICQIDPDQDASLHDKVVFVPYIGVGPRHFFELFSIRHGGGLPLTRKDKTGHAEDFHPILAKPRIGETQHAILEREKTVITQLAAFRGTLTPEPTADGIHLTPTNRPPIIPAPNMSTPKPVKSNRTTFEQHSPIGSVSSPSLTSRQRYPHFRQQRANEV